MKRIIVDGFQLPPGFTEENFHSAVNYKPRSDDIFIVTFPKCGTTWMQQIVYMILKKGKIPYGPTPLGSSSPFLELIGADAINDYERPFPIKTHLPFERQPWDPAAKYIYVARNPKDVLVSFWHHNKDINSNSEYYSSLTFDDFITEFLNGKTDFGDYFHHTVSWWKNREKENILFIRYEEMKGDLGSIIRRVAEFLSPAVGKCLEEDGELIDRIRDQCSVEKMQETVNKSMKKFLSMSPKELREDEGIPETMKKCYMPMFESKERFLPHDWKFVRKGIIGDWRNHLDEEQSERVNGVIYERFANHPELLDFWRPFI